MISFSDWKLLASDISFVRSYMIEPNSKALFYVDRIKNRHVMIAPLKIIC